MKNQIVTFLLLIFCLFGCGAFDDTEIAPAYLHDDNIEIFISDTRPVFVVVGFNIGLNGCDSYHDTHYEWTGNTCIIKPEMVLYTGNDDCPSIYDIHRVAIIILEDIAPGVYEVIINNIRKDFEVKAKQTDECRFPLNPVRPFYINAS